MKKWVMKQYWRVGTIRALTSLGLGMLVLGRMYYVYIPVLQDMGFFGAVTLGIFLIFFFMGLGWLYDEKGRLWSQKTQAITERSIYQYVPNFKTLAIDFPMLLVTAHTIRNVLKQIGLSTETIDDMILLLDQNFSLKPVKRDLVKAQMIAEEFWEKDANQFSQTEKSVSEKISWDSRTKLAFETQMLRLNWIQSLTGIVQDVLVFGVFYVVIVFPGLPNELELLIAVFGISIPLLIILLIAGWYYDKKLRIWSADAMVKVERNPYTYVAEPYLFAAVLPFFYTYMVTLRRIVAKKGMCTQEIDVFLKYMKDYSNLLVSNEKDFQGALNMRKALGATFRATEKES